MRGCLGCCVYKGVGIHYTIVCLEGGKGNEKIIISTVGCGGQHSRLWR